jgi:hypothetical protein
MVIRKCERCGKSWGKKSSFNRHINRKFKCQITDKVDIKQDDINDVKMIKNIIEILDSKKRDNELLKNNENVLIDHPIVIIIDKKKYYNADDLFKYDPMYFKGCINPRNIVKKKNIHKDEYEYAQLKNDEWVFVNEEYKKAKLLLRKRYVDKNVPKMMKDIDPNEINDKYDTPLAPEILELEDHEKFKDVDGNLIDIEVRGERDRDKCYFEIHNISEGFGLGTLYRNVTDNRSNGYLENVHYKYFNVEKNKKYVKKLFITFYGFDRILSVCYLFSQNVKNILKMWLHRTFSSYNVSNITIDMQKQVNLTTLGYVYCAYSSVISGYVKIGFWRGNLDSLRSRYVTYYGNDVKIHAYEFSNAPFIEKEVHKKFDEYRYCNELFDRKYLEHYLIFLEENEEKIGEKKKIYKNNIECTYIPNNRNVNSLGDMPPKFIGEEQDELFSKNIDMRKDKNGNIFFDIIDVAAYLDIDDYENQVLKDLVYEEDYLFFIDNNELNAQFSRKLFLTYMGLVRVLMVSRSKNAVKFQEWATNILFTHHLGTQKQKDDLAASLLGINTKTVKDVFRSNSEKTPVVYLFLIGHANIVLKDGKDYGDNKLLCKFGCTEDLVKRTSQHEARYKKDYGNDI